MFNIFINDISYFLNSTKIANYADDNNTYSTEDNVDKLVKIFEEETSVLLEWFKLSEMKSNEDKCHLLVVNHQDEVMVKLRNGNIIGSSCVDLLGVKIDKSQSQKLHALVRISKYINKDKLKVIMKTFIISQFNYCLLVWMFHNRNLNSKINKLHERALGLLIIMIGLRFKNLLNCTVPCQFIIGTYKN